MNIEIIIIVSFLGVIVLFSLVRIIILWYFKITDRVEIQKEILIELKKINNTQDE